MPKSHKSIGLLSNTGPDFLKNHKATKPTFNVGPSSARLVKRHLNDVSLAGQCWHALVVSTLPSSTQTEKKN